MFNISIAGKYWAKANLSVITKMLSELYFQGLLDFKEIEKVAKEGKSNNPFFDECLLLETEKANWTFNVRRTIWGMLLIDPDSIESSREGALEAEQFIADIQPCVKKIDINLSGWVEDIKQILVTESMSMQRYDNARTRAANKGDARSYFSSSIKHFRNDELSFSGYNFKLASADFKSA